MHLAAPGPWPLSAGDPAYDWKKDGLGHISPVSNQDSFNCGRTGSYQERLAAARSQASVSSLLAWFLAEGAGLAQG